MAEARAATRVIVHHPGSNHLAYRLVSGLQAEGFDARFETGYFHDPAGALARIAARVPRLARELMRRSSPGVDVARVRLHPLPELATVLAARLGVGGERLARIVGWRNEVFDRAVAGVVRRERPRAVIGHDGSALFAGRAAREAGALAALNQVTGHVEAALAIFAEEARRHPQFAERDAGLPEAIVARHRAELAEADAILAPSDYVRDTLTARGVPDSRIAVIPYGVDVARFAPRERPRDDGRFRLLFVGHLGARKGIQYALEAVKRLGRADVELVAVGRMIAPQAAFAPYASFFRHVPAVPFHEVATLFRDADAFVFPSLHEGSAFVTYEALASGLPVIATPNAGSVVRDGVEGHVVPIRDVDALAERIEALRADPTLRARMAEAARARALEFTWDAYRARVGAWLDSRLASRP